MTPETLVKQKLKKMLNHNVKHMGGTFFYSAISDRYHSGLPDFILIEAGRPKFLECKAPGKHLTRLQKSIALKLIKAGADYFEITIDDGELKWTEIF